MRCEWLYAEDGEETRCEAEAEYLVINLTSGTRHRFCRQHKVDYVEGLASDTGTRDTSNVKRIEGGGAVKLMVTGRGR
ncbi:MAG: hypothetical protein QW420_03150 [Candidatus Caldarchaeum sp.]